MKNGVMHRRLEQTRRKNAVKKFPQREVSFDEHFLREPLLTTFFAPHQLRPELYYIVTVLEALLLSI